MNTIQFYHLTATPLERALPKLLEKAYDGGFTTLLVADSEEYVEHLNELLWTYDPGSFLPHGSVKDGNVGQQPILLSTSTSLGGGWGGGWGGHPSPHHGKIGEAEFTSRNPETLVRAKELRKNATDAENKLWYFLQQANLGYSFRKQHPVGHYIADFACIEKMLVIEIDGGQHDDQQTYDNERRAFLEKAGYKVLRFWNNEVLENCNGVLEVIQEQLQRGTHPPCPPVHGGVKPPTLLLVTNGATPENLSDFDRILDIFDGNDAQAVAKARSRWADYKKTGCELAYLRQTESGGWEKKA